MLLCRPNFGFTVNFVVSVDGNFLQHLQKVSNTYKCKFKIFALQPLQSCIQLEVNQAMGYKYQLVGVACVRCRELVTSAGGKVHGKAVLVGAEVTRDCVGVGGVEYWMRLKLPIAQTAKLHQVRSKNLPTKDV